MKVGFGQSDLTPRLGVQLAGFGPYRNRAATSILAPISARAVVLTERKRTAVVLSLESCGTPRVMAARVRDAVAARIGCPARDVFIAATHTHAAPAIGGSFGWGEADAVYAESLPARVADAAAIAAQNQTDVTWRYGEAPCEGIAVNRETDAGFAMTADFATRLDPAWRPARPQDTDPTVRVLAAYDEVGKLRGLLHHFGCHPVVCGEQTSAVHGDFVGLGSRQLERRFPGSVALFLPGALGDINPSLNHRNPAESRIAVRALGRRYASAVASALRVAAGLPTGGFHSIARDVTFARAAWTRQQVEQRITGLEQLFNASGATDDTSIGIPPLHTRGMEMTRLQGLRAIRDKFEGQRAPNPPVALHGLRIGPCALLGCGLEVYHALQTPVLQASPHAHTWVVSLVGGIGYAPDASTQQRAGYSDDFVPLMLGELPYKNVHEELPAALTQLASDLATSVKQPRPHATQRST